MLALDARQPLVLMNRAVLHYEVSLSLPDQNETVTNGALPANTIQGLTTSITWSFNELQRDATTTNA